MPASYGNEWMQMPHYGAPPPLMALAVAGSDMSFEEKTRLGDDIHKLAEEDIMGLLSVIQQSNRGLNDGVVQGQQDEEVELDLNRYARLHSGPDTTHHGKQPISACPHHHTTTP